MSRGTKNRNFRAEDEIWIPAQEVANERGEILSDQLREFLKEYVRRHRPESQPREAE